MSELDKLVKEHWAYIDELLKTHDEVYEVRERIRFHYISAFKHGWKHAMEEKKNE